MALTSTLYTGLSGLDVNQVKLNVVGNNIANVNTVAYKSSRTLVKPQFYVTDEAGSPPSSDFGGENPSQRGLGAIVAGIEKNFAPGSIEPTGRPTDLAIDGDGFFIVQGEAQRFTRDGSFKLNSANQLVTTDGQFVQGFGVDANFNVLPGTIQNITIPLGTSTSAQATENVNFEGNLNASGAVASGTSILNSQELTVVGGASQPTSATLLTSLASASDSATALFTAGQTYTLSGTKGGRDLADAELVITASTTLGDLASFYQSGLGIDTTVPDDGDATTPAPGVTIDNGATANSVMLTVAGNLGEQNALELPSSSFTNATGASPFAFQEGVDSAGNASGAVGESIHTSFVAYDSLGTPINVSLTCVFESAADTGNIWRFYAESGADTDADLAVGTGTLTFDNEGKLTSSAGTTITVDRAGTGAKTPMTVTLDFSSLTALTSRDSEMVMTRQDGSPIGSLSTFSIGSDGTITGNFTNGLTRTLGQVAIATFSNTQGLIDRGGNMFVTGPSSGVPIIGSPLTLGAGSVRSGALELSNVDLSEEFINLIIATTGFTAASRVITTSDQLLTELLNTSR